MYNQAMVAKTLKGEAISWCGTKITIEVRTDDKGELYFQKLDTELPTTRIQLKRVRDACNYMLEELRKDGR